MMYMIFHVNPQTRMLSPNRVTSTQGFQPRLSLLGWNSAKMGVTSIMFTLGHVKKVSGVPIWVHWIIQPTM